MPLSDIELRNLEVYSWQAIGERFIGSDLLLGNGFSMNLVGGFSYNSLFQEFVDCCEGDDRDRWERFGSTNFELIMQRLTNALRINEIFGIDCAEMNDALTAVRRGLVGAIQRIHPRYDDIGRENLQRIAHELVPFDDIYTLNYDLLLYHIIMLLRDMSDESDSVRPYNDYFWGHRNDAFLEFRDYQNYAKYKHVYYLHGALFLFKAGYLDLKVRRAGNTSELVDLISEIIEGGAIPLFVSEGTAEDKLLAISGSNYLRFALSSLQESVKSLVIFGTSLPMQIATL